jgi:uracil-DNA glycosylase
MTKPELCKACPFAKSSTGFCGDFAPANPRIAVVLKMPGKEDLIWGPMSGKAGRYWFREFMEPCGLTRETILFSSVIRCFPNGGEFPIGAQRKAAIASCREWDGKLKLFAPNVFGVSVNPAILLRNPQQTKFLRRAMQRAVEYADAGYRPCVLLGEEARDKYAPWLQGQMKRWQGHWFEGTV